MVGLGATLFIVGFLAGIVFLVLAAKDMIKKNGKAKRKFAYVGGSFGLVIVSLVLIGIFADPVPAENTKTNDKQVDSEKTKEAKAADLNAKEEAQQKESAEKEAAEKKEKEEAAAKKEAEKEAKKQAELRAKQQAEAEKKANAQTIDYSHLKKNPDRYSDQYVKYVGQIVQIQESGHYTAIRLAVTQTSYGYDFNDIIWVEYDGLTDFVEDDIVTVYGEIAGTKSYKSTAGWKITIPAIVADHIE
ncbi:hypothetical protein [Bacillus testis]|uniref:hypothetical protein n=1 Tax=Bacillus testis TaxID=1622072 RepID=UPI00067EF89F|nr:hypothetical protein [Bacillus testis]